MHALGRVLVAGAVLTICAPRTGLAQRPQKRQGFWMGAGFGYGSLVRTCDRCVNTPREGAVTGYLKLGTTVTPQLLMGAEVSGWRKDLQGTIVTSVNASVTSYVYVKPTSGFFFKGGFGLSWYREEPALRDPSDTVGTIGFGITAGLGYDLRVGNNISLTPVGDFVFGSLGNLRLRRQLVPNVQQTLLLLGLGVTFH
jgi:hypothetical protein